MVHTLAFWYGDLPRLVDPAHRHHERGAPNYLACSPKNLDCIPDTFQVSMSHNEKLFFTFTSMFGNNYYGEGHDFLFGTKATLIHTDSDQVHVVPQGKKLAAKPGLVEEGYKEMTGLHMQNFFDCVRSRKEPVCPFELGFRTSIACQMAVASYRRQGTVRWDPATEEII